MTDLTYAPGYNPAPLDTVSIKPVRELLPTERITGLFKAIEGEVYHVWFVVENWETASHASGTYYVGAKLVKKEEDGKT
jgi:hypothetical protein